MKTRFTITITMNLAMLGILALAQPAQASVVLYQENFVDPAGDSGTGWGTHGGYVGRQINNAASQTGWRVRGGGEYSAVVSNQWGSTPSPDGDAWHFFGFNDSGSALLYSAAGEVSIAAVDRVQTEFSASLAKTSNNGLRWMAKVGTAWYFTDEFLTGTGNHGSVTQSGVVSAWQYATLDVEAANTWYLYTDTNLADNDPTNGGWTGHTLDGNLSITSQALPAGDITGVGFFVRKGNNSHRLAVDNVRITAAAIPEPSAALLGGLGVLALLRRRRS